MVKFLSNNNEGAAVVTASEFSGYIWLKRLQKLELNTSTIQEDKIVRPEKQQGSRWRWHLAALLIFGLLTLLMLGPVVGRADKSLEQWGDALLQTWTLDWDAYAFLHNPSNLFNANAFYPYNNSLAFSESLVGQAVLVAPLIWLTDNPVLGFNLLLLLSFVLSGWGVYLLVYELTGRPVAGMVAGIIFAFFPNRFLQLSHLHLLATQWMPFCLLFLRRFLQSWKWRDGVLFGLFLVLELLSSTYLGLFLVATVGLYLLYKLIANLKNGWIFKQIGRTQLAPTKYAQGRGNLAPTSADKQRRTQLAPTDINEPSKIGQMQLAPTNDANLSRTAINRQSSIVNRQLILSPQSSVLSPQSFRLLVVLALSALIVLPFLWPYLEVQRDLGFERSPAEVISWSAQPFYYLDIPKDNRLNQWFYKPLFKQDWWSGGGAERALYLGLTAMVLGLVGVAVAWQRRKREGDALFYVLLTLAAFIFTFGPAWQSGRFGNVPLPYALLYNYVPGFQGLRVPVRFIYVVALGVAVLAGFAVAALQERLRLFSLPKAALLAVGLCGLLCLEYASDVSVNESGILRGEAPPAAKWLAAHPGPVLNVPLSGSDSSNLFYQYWSRGAWQPVMNGFSGFMPPAYDALKTAVARDGFGPQVITLLQGLEVRYVVVDSEDDAIRPNWTKLKGQLEQGTVGEVARFGGTYIYELKPDNWLRKLTEHGLNSESALYFVEYRRNDPQLLELAAYFMQRTGLSKRESIYGNITIGFRPLPALPANQPADFLLIEAGEDPTLYGFRPEDKLFGNALLDCYKRSPLLLARADFSRSSGLATPGAVRVRGTSLEFSGSFTPQPGQAKEQHLKLTLAALKPQSVRIWNGATEQKLQLEPGVSSVEIPAGNESVTALEMGEARLLSAELWQGATNNAGKVILRQDVVLLEATGLREGESGVATVKLVPKGGVAGDYTATLDVYNYPWGAHPQGHYGYWSVPINGGNATVLEYRLGLVQKQMATRLNGSDTPNYPPDPKQLDITKYGRFGDFRASFNLYAGDKLAGSVRLFDFTIYTQGDKNRLDNRHIGAFSGYNTGVVLLVLPPEKKN